MQRLIEQNVLRDLFATFCSINLQVFLQAAKILIGLSSAQEHQSRPMIFIHDLHNPAGIKLNKLSSASQLDLIQESSDDSRQNRVSVRLVFGNTL